MSGMFELNNVTKIYGEITALNNITLKIPRNQIFTIIGPNGSGKTTLLKILAFLERLTKGTLLFDGELVKERNLDRLRLNSTMVFQKTTLFDTTVAKNIAYGLRLRGSSKNEIAGKIRNALRIVRLEGYEKRHAKKLSGGEQQRVALARALALNTKLLLLDEPTANLDPKNACIIEEIIATVNRESKATIVMATHNMFQAKNLPQRIALITNGKISEVGTPTEIFGGLSKTLISFAALENTFNGNAKVTEDGTTVVDIGNGVQIEATVQRHGKISVFVSPEDIILSERRFTSSARNVLKGRIVDISDLGSVVRLRVDVGKPFIVQITKRSFSEIRLNLNTEVFLAFKASSVQIV
jgi:tungstate transport system ATP-binding protein